MKTPKNQHSPGVLPSDTPSDTRRKNARNRGRFKAPGDAFLDGVLPVTFPLGCQVSGDTPALPVITGRIEGHQITVQCPFCHRTHRHGLPLEPPSRVAHCREGHGREYRINLRLTRCQV